MKYTALKYFFILWGFFPYLVFSQTEDDLQFIENKGQFENPVLYRCQLPSGFVYLEKNAITFKLFDEKEFAQAHVHRHNTKEDIEETPIRGHVFRYVFHNGNLDPAVNGLKAFSENFNFFLGNDKRRWASDVKAYSEVLYTDFYPGIDLKIYSKYGQIKYEWIVRSEGNPSDIDIELQGLDSIALHENAIILKTSIGKFTDKNLDVFELGNSLSTPVMCKYHLKNNHISYIFPKGFNRKNTLVIDPILIFSTYSGSKGDNFGYTATFDLRGNLYAGGITDNTHGEYPVTSGAFQTKCKGGAGRKPVNLPCDITISKYDSSGKKLLYATYIGGSDDDYPHSMVVNSDSELVVFGTTYSANFPMAKGYDTTHNSAGSSKFTDIVIFKLSKNGNQLLGSTYYGGNNHDGLTDSIIKYNYADDFRGEVLTDKSDNIFVVSSSNSSNLPLKNESKSSLEGKADGLCLKFSKNLDQLLWATYFGGDSSDGIYSLEFDANENIYVAGGTKSTNLAVHSTALDKTANGNIDGFMAVFNKSSFALNNCTYYGTSSYDQIYFLEIDKIGNIYATGQTTGNITPSSNVYCNKTQTGQFIVITDASLSKINKQTVFGSQVNDPNFSPTAFLVDSCGNIYISGWGSDLGDGHDGHVGTTSGLPITSNAIQKTTDGNDFYLAVFARNLGGLLYATYFGGNRSDDHVDGGTSRFDKRGVIYQSVCASCPATPGATLNDFPTTSGSAFPKNVSWRCSNAAFKIDFQINNVVKAKFIPDPTLCGPALIQFTNQSKGNGTYQWDFGDGKKSNVKDPLHSYLNVGKYTISLIAIDSNTCNISDTIIKEVNVLQRPLADFEIKNIPCTGKLEIINKSEDYTTTDWDYGNGYKDTSLNPLMYEYPNAGFYKIRLITDAKKLCSDTFVVAVIIQSDTFVKAAFMPDSVLCGMAETQFTNLSIGRGSFQWFFGDGKSSVEKNPKHIFPVGKFKVTLIATDSFKCKTADTAIHTITTLQPPSADFEIKNIPCTGKVEIINKSTNYTTTDWDYDNGHKDQSINPPMYEYGQPGLYKIKLITDAQKLCSDTAVVQVLIRNNTIVIADFVPDTSVCVLAEIRFTNFSSNASRYSWNFGDGDSSDAFEPQHLFGKEGTYTVRLIATDSITCNINDTATRTVNVIKPGKAAFEIKQFECSSRIEIVNKSENFKTGSWDFGNGDTSNLPNPPSFEYQNMGIYKIQLITDAEELCPDTAWLEIDVKSTPSDEIIPVNVFTPDGDGFNDCFHFGGRLNECSKIKIVIYNRWGLKVFETKDYNQCWNGNVNNGKKECPEGTYFYICEYKGESSKIEPLFSGTVTLIRK